ncbi:MAG: hemerythrin domain-containing protein [Silvibacterium sp.]
MLMQIGQKLESDFSEPIGMLEDCHKRILFFLRSLATIAEAADEGRLSVEHRDSLEKALKYFREAAPKHTADEEESLFPQLRLIDNLQVRTVFAKLDGLEADHRWADAQHREIDTIGRLWLSNGVCADENRHRFKTLLEYLLKFYERHIALEESEIFSIARSLLPESTRRQLGREMAQRRGITEQ